MRPKSSRTIYILTASTLLIATAIFVWGAVRKPAVLPAQPPAPVDQAGLHAAWLSAVRRWTDGLSAASPPAQAAQAKTALLKLSVAAADREAHLSIILALAGMERGDAGSYAVLAEARHRLGLIP